MSSSSSLSSSHPPSSSDADYYYEPSYSGNDTYAYYDGEYPSSANASSSSSAPFPMPAFMGGGGGGGDSFGVCDCAVCQAKPEMRPPDFSPLSRYLWSQKMQPTPEELRSAKEVQIKKYFSLI